MVPTRETPAYIKGNRWHVAIGPPSPIGMQLTRCGLRVTDNPTRRVHEEPSENRCSECWSGRISTGFL